MIIGNWLFFFIVGGFGTVMGEQRGCVDRKNKEKDVFATPFTLHPPSVEGAFFQS